MTNCWSPCPPTTKSSSTAWGTKSHMSKMLKLTYLSLTLCEFVGHSMKAGLGNQFLSVAHHHCLWHLSVLSLPTLVDLAACSEECGCRHHWLVAVVVDPPLVAELMQPVDV